MRKLEIKVDKVEHANLVSVLREQNAAKRLNLRTDNYTGTTIYNSLMKSLRSNTKTKPLTVGNLLFYPKADVVALVETYIERKTIGAYKKDIDALLKAVKRDPSKARTALQHINSNN